MGTRGRYGFRYKGKTYFVWRSCDSYRHGLGASIVEEIKQAIKSGEIKNWLEKLEKVTEVDCDQKLSESELAKLPESKLSERINSWDPKTWKDATWANLFAEFDSLALASILKHERVPMQEDCDQWDYAYAYDVNLDTMKLDFYSCSTLEYSYPFDNLPNWLYD